MGRAEGGRALSGASPFDPAPGPAGGVRQPSAEPCTGGAATAAPPGAAGSGFPAGVSADSSSSSSGRGMSQTRTVYVLGAPAPVLQRWATWEGGHGFRVLGSGVRHFRVRALGFKVLGSGI